MKGKKHRLTLEISDVVKLRMHRLRESTDAASLTEVIRRALATYELLIDGVKDGGGVIIRRLDGTEQHVLLVPE